MQRDVSNAMDKIRKIKARYLDDGIEIVGIFGSVARNSDNILSDIDITYKLDYDLFFKKYKDGFSQILKLQEVKEVLEKALHRRVDFVSMSSCTESLKEEIERDLVHV